ncbi:rsbT co-antagonist protein RsbR [Scopulibacillus daqui]|uniref:RsbT co-antagonist protein RsbR n=1 Tax=Scopulibacillus daqui TaxID=1469162 RepID=A0ABS2PWP9_9BACL|nr:STAS domain-containing protein [Scopulibacillus daqui]MBM7644450.1 rsbT co-antagonist protein RsbR [Scopulibacillus daqui]
MIEDLDLNSRSLEAELGKKIMDNASKIAEQAYELYQLNYPETKDDKYILKNYTTFIQIVGEGLFKNSDYATEKIIDLSKQIGDDLVQTGQILNIAIQSISILRIKIWGFIEKEIEQASNITIKDMSKLSLNIGTLLDNITYGFSSSYVESHKQLSEAFFDSLQELSVPVVPVFEGVAILPLIGELDTRRAKFLSDEALKRSRELNLNALILDLSGVSYVDTMVANRIFQLVEALSLLGVKTIITGISPAIAMTAVGLNINLDKLTIRSNLQQALEILGYGRI